MLLVEDGLVQINPVEVFTTTEAGFCSIKCLDHPGCNSFAYLTYTSSENCLLSSSVDGASVSGASGVVEVYKKVEPKVPKVSLHIDTVHILERGSIYVCAVYSI